MNRTHVPSQISKTFKISIVLTHWHVTLVKVNFFGVNSNFSILVL